MGLLRNEKCPGKEELRLTNRFVGGEVLLRALAAESAFRMNLRGSPLDQLFSICSDEAGARSDFGGWICSPFYRIGCAALLILAVFSCPAAIRAQQGAPAPTVASTAELPDAPRPQDEISQESSTSQQPVSATPAEKSEREKAAEQVREQEHQRILGVIPMFNTSYRGDAVSLTRKQKMSLAFHSAVDPVTFATAFVVAGLHEGFDDDPGFGWGAEGYFKRSGAAYLDTFDGTMIGNGILPSLLHQDPRYFRLGHGPTRHRLLYAVAMSVICKHDVTGKWEPNYSNIIGNISSGALSNLYYPTNESGFGQTINNGMVVTAEGTLGSVFQEFWPDISRKLFHKDPTHGLDAQASELDKAAKHPEETKKPRK